MEKSEEGMAAKKYLWVWFLAAWTAGAWGCSEKECDKLQPVEWTQLSRYCSAGGAGTALCFCWEHDSVLAGWTPGSCTDGVDNDGDGLTDCEDSDCLGAEACRCSDGVDNDRDGLTDCEDPECAYSNACCSVHERAYACCTDGRDNDGDGLTDCEEDPDCAGACCSDGIDNDGDGLTDCDDPDCAGNLDCCTAADSEACACDDGQDNDGDGLTDCEDEDCARAPACWDPRASRFSERTGYCVDRFDAMEQACEEDYAAAQLEALDPAQLARLAETGLFGKFRVTASVRWTYRRSSGALETDEPLDEPLVQGLDWIVFEPTGWFRSNISDGVWQVRLSDGEPTASVVVAFLNDDCLADRFGCDTTDPFNYRLDGDGMPMVYTWQEAPQGSDMYLGTWSEPDDETLVFEGIRLEP